MRVKGWNNYLKKEIWQFFKDQYYVLCFSSLYEWNNATFSLYADDVSPDPSDGNIALQSRLVFNSVPGS